MVDKSGYRIVLEDCMGAKDNEKVLILTDDNKIEIGKELYKIAKD